MKRRTLRKLYRDYCELHFALNATYEDIARVKYADGRVRDQLVNMSRQRSISIQDKIQAIQDKFWNHLEYNEDQRKKSTMSSVARSLNFLSL